MSNTEKIIFTSFLLVFALTFVSFSNIYAQTSQETINQYISDLQKHPDDFALKEKIIRYVRGMRKAPSIPEEARRHHVMAVTLLKDARDVREYSSAVEEFKIAVLAAPWWPTAYRDLGVALKGAERYAEAIEALQLYLLTEPSEKDARQAQDQIYVLEAKQKKLAADRAAALQKEAEAREKARIDNLPLFWQNEDHTSGYEVYVSGTNIKITYTIHFSQGQWQEDGCPGTWIWTGTVTDGANITGTFTRDYSCVFNNGQKFTRSMTGTISADRKKINLKYNGVSPNGANGRYATGWMETGGDTLNLVPQ